MALMTINYLSPSLGMQQSFVAIIPEDASFFDETQSPKSYKSLMLLHGLSSDATSYTRFTSVERYADEHQLAIIMPNADHSGYANMTYGHSYYDHILKCITTHISYFHYHQNVKIILLQVIRWVVTAR